MSGEWSIYISNSWSELQQFGLMMGTKRTRKGTRLGMEKGRGEQGDNYVTISNGKAKHNLIDIVTVILNCTRDFISTFYTYCHSWGLLHWWQQLRKRRKPIRWWMEGMRTKTKSVSLLLPLKMVRFIKRFSVEKICLFRHKFCDFRYAYFLHLFSFLFFSSFLSSFLLISLYFFLEGCIWSAVWTYIRK